MSLEEVLSSGKMLDWENDNGKKGNREVGEIDVG